MVRTKEVYPYQLQNEISKLWKNNPDEWKQYHVVRNFLKQNPQFQNLSERTIMRYLSYLVKTGFLEKKIEPTHRTWYKPRDRKQFLKAVLNEKIDKLDEECLRMLDTFSLLLLTEQYKSIQKSEPKKFFGIAESAKKRFLEIKHAQNMIRQAVESIEKEKLKASA